MGLLMKMILMTHPLACPHPPLLHPLSLPLTSAVLRTAPPAWLERQLHQLCIGKHCLAAVCSKSNILTLAPMLYSSVSMLANLGKFHYLQVLHCYTISLQ